MADPHKAVMKLVEEDEEVYEISYVEGLETALAFYADPKHWESVEVEKISDVLSTWVSGAAVDGGARARAAFAGCLCACHDVIQPGLIPCPHCDHSSRSGTPQEA